MFLLLHLFTILVFCHESLATEFDHESLATEFDHESLATEFDHESMILKSYSEILSPHSPLLYYALKDAEEFPPRAPFEPICAAAGGEGLCLAPMAYKVCDRLLDPAEKCSKNKVSDKWHDPCYCVHDTNQLSHKDSFCCQFQNKTVEPSDFVLRHQVVHLSNSTDLHVQVDPHYVDRLHVANVTGLHVTLVEDFEDSSMYFSASYSRGLKVPRSALVGLHNCNFTRIKNLQGLLELNLFETSVKNVAFVSFSDSVSRGELGPGFRNYRGLQMIHSHVEKLYNVSVNSTAYIAATIIYGIANVTAKDLQVFGSLFGFIDFRGLMVTNYLEMFNQSIAYLSEEGIFADSTATVVLKNVTVKSCVEPCIRMGRDAKLINVTINGRPCNDLDDPAYKIADLPPEYTTLKRNVCSTNGMEIKCNLTSHHEGLQMNLNDGKDEYKIVISNHKDLQIKEGCLLGLEIENVQGHYVSNTKLTCNKRLPVTIRRSNLFYLASSKIGNLTIVDDSEVQFMRVEFLQNYYSLNCNVLYIYNITYQKMSKNDSFLHEGGNIRKIHHILFKDPAVMRNVTVEKIDRLQIVYDSMERISTLLVDCVIHNVKKYGIHVYRGSLSLYNVKFSFPISSMIKIDEQGKVFLLRSDRNIQEACKSTGPIFSALYRHQVVVLDGPAPDWLASCISYRTPASDLAGVGRAAVHSRMPIDPSTHCIAKAAYTHYCDVSMITKLLVLGNSQLVNHVRRITVHGARDLLLGQHCFSEVTLSSCDVQDIQEEATPCYFNLLMIASEADQIVNKIWNLVIEDSKVDRIKLQNYAENVTIANSEVRNLDLSNVKQVEISTSKILNFQKVKIHNKMKVEHSEVIVFHKSSIVLNNGSSMSIVNSTIGTLSDHAMAVEGGILVFDNVEIQVWSGEGIKIGPSATIRLLNVKIQSYSRHLLSLLDHPSVFAEKLVVGDCTSPKMSEDDVLSDTPFVNQLFIELEEFGLEDTCRTSGLKRKKRHVQNTYEYNLPYWQYIITQAFGYIILVILANIIFLGLRKGWKKLWSKEKDKQEGVEDSISLFDYCGFPDPRDKRPPLGLGAAGSGTYIEHSPADATYAQVLDVSIYENVPEGDIYDKLCSEALEKVSLREDGTESEYSNPVYSLSRESSQQWPRQSSFGAGSAQPARTHQSEHSNPQDASRKLSDRKTKSLTPPFPSVPAPSSQNNIPIYENVLFKPSNEGSLMPHTSQSQFQQLGNPQPIAPALQPAPYASSFDTFSAITTASSPKPIHQGARPKNIQKKPKTYRGVSSLSKPEEDIAQSLLSQTDSANRESDHYTVEELRRKFEKNIW